MSTSSTDRLAAELRRVFGDPPVSPRAVVRVQVGRGVADGQGLEAGRTEGDRLVDAGAELVVLDSEGTSPGALAVLGALLDLEPIALLPPTNDPGWSHDLVALRAALRTGVEHRFSPEELVNAVDDPVLGRLVGLLDRLTQRATPVLIGGGTSVAIATLVVSRLRPSSTGLILAGSRPAEQNGARALDATHLTALLDLGLEVGAADVAVAVVRAGLELLGA